MYYGKTYYNIYLNFVKLLTIHLFILSKAVAKLLHETEVNVELLKDDEEKDHVRFLIEEPNEISRVRKMEDAFMHCLPDGNVFLKYT